MAKKPLSGKPKKPLLPEKKPKPLLPNSPKKPLLPEKKPKKPLLKGE
ncbi:MAG: hypothetical protein ABIN36_18165 [Ferruginibacter sp.]